MLRILLDRNKPELKNDPTVTISEMAVLFLHEKF